MTLDEMAKEVRDSACGDWFDTHVVQLLDQRDRMKALLVRFLACDHLTIGCLGKDPLLCPKVPQSLFREIEAEVVK